MSAREELHEIMCHCGWYGHTAAPGECDSTDYLIDAYAHELAQKIRSLRDAGHYEPDSPEYKHMSGSADLIDPKVRT